MSLRRGRRRTAAEWVGRIETAALAI